MRKRATPASGATALAKAVVAANQDVPGTPTPEMSVDLIRTRVTTYDAIIRDRILRLADNIRESANKIERHAKPGSKWDAFEGVEEAINDLTWGIANYHLGQLVADLKRMQTWRAMLIAATNGQEGVQ